jgi:hypothetical protein
MWPEATAAIGPLGTPARTAGGPPEARQWPSLPLVKDYVAGFFETHETHPSLKKGSHRSLYPRAFMPVGKVGELPDKMFKNGLRVHRARQRQVTLTSAAAGSSSLTRPLSARASLSCSTLGSHGPASWPSNTPAVTRPNQGAESPICRGWG